MNELFKKVQVAGIITPGQCYLMNADSDGGYNMDLTILYLLRKEAATVFCRGLFF